MVLSMLGLRSLTCSAPWTLRPQTETPLCRWRGVVDGALRGGAVAHVPHRAPVLEPLGALLRSVDFAAAPLPCCWELLCDRLPLPGRRGGVVEGVEEAV